MSVECEWRQGPSYPLVLPIDKGGGRREHVPRYHKQQYYSREKRTEQRRLKESAPEEVVVSHDAWKAV